MKARSGSDKTGMFRVKDGVGKLGTVLVALTASAVLVVGIFCVWSRMQLVQIGYEISRLEKTNKELQKRRRELILEHSSLQSPAELERKARGPAGLVFPSIDRIVHVP